MEDLSTAIYLIEWEDLHVVEQREILFMLMRSQVIVDVTAGGYFNLNYQLVTKVR